MENAQTVIINKVKSIVNKYHSFIKDNEVVKEKIDIIQKMCKGWEKDPFDNYCPIEIPYVSVETTQIIRADVHLIGYFYSLLAGEEASKDIVEMAPASNYIHGILTKEEEKFLKDNYALMVSYLIQVPQDDLISHEDYNLYGHCIDSALFDIISSSIEVKDNAEVNCYGFATFQLIPLLCNCNIHTNAIFISKWEKILSNIMAFATNNVFTTEAEQQGKCDVAILQYDSEHLIDNIKDVYNNVSDGGKIEVFVSASCLYDSTKSKDEYKEFISSLAKDGFVTKIIELPFYYQEDNFSNAFNDGLEPINHSCLVEISKGVHSEKITLIDASNCRNKKNNFDSEMFFTMIGNGGYDSEGNRRMTSVDVKDLMMDYLLPSGYTEMYPDNYIPLSSICHVVADADLDIDSYTPIINTSCFLEGHKGNLDLDKCSVVGSFDLDRYRQAKEKKGKPLSISGMDIKMCKLARCKVLPQNSNLVLVDNSDGIKFVLASNTSKVSLVSDNICALSPNEGEDVMTLFAILRTSCVQKQIKRFGIRNFEKHMDRILVPKDDNTIRNGIESIEREQKIYEELISVLDNSRIEYKNEVRLRKHDMSQPLQQLRLNEELMRHILSHPDEIENPNGTLLEMLDRTKFALEQMSNILVHLSDDDSFGKPELFNIDKYFNEMPDGDGFEINYSYDEEALVEYGFPEHKMTELFRERMENSSKDSEEILTFLKERLPEHDHVPLFVNIAPVDFERLVMNIITNAKQHGFTDSTRNDYELEIHLSIDKEKRMFVIDFYNNGNPWPKGMTKERYGLKGEKAGTTGGTGCGGHIVKKIVTHYNGDYDIFEDNIGTAVRIYLPIA